MSNSGTAGYLLQHLATVMSKQSDQALQERLGIGFSQFKIMRVLERKPHIQQRQIADLLGQTEASISRQIKLMVDKGLLVTSVNPANRREHVTTLTSKGLRLNEESLRVLMAAYDQVFEVLGDKRLLQLVASLTEVHERTCLPGRIGSCNHIEN